MATIHASAAIATTFPMTTRCNTRSFELAGRNERNTEMVVKTLGNSQRLVTVAHYTWSPQTYSMFVDQDGSINKVSIREPIQFLNAHERWFSRLCTSTKHWITIYKWNQYPIVIYFPLLFHLSLTLLYITFILCMTRHPRGNPSARNPSHPR